MLRKLVFGACAVAGSITLGAASCQPPPPPPYVPSSTLVSLGDGNVLGNGSVQMSSTSASGGETVFVTGSSNVIPGDPGPGSFIRHNATGEVERIADLAVAQRLSLSADGRYVTYTTPRNDIDGIPARTHVYDSAIGTTQTIDDGQYGPFFNVLPADASMLLTAFSPTHVNGYRWECGTRKLNHSGTTRDCPLNGSDRVQGQVYSTSRNGRFVAYSWVSTDGSTTGMLLWDIISDTLEDLPVSLGYPIGVSDDGRFITSTDQSGALQLDRQSGNTTRAPGTRDALGASRDGKFVYTFPRGTPANPSPAHTLARWNTRSNRIDDFSSLGPYPLPGHCDITLGLRVTDDGSACWGSRDALDPSDTNGLEDIYLVN